MMMVVWMMMMMMTGRLTRHQDILRKGRKTARKCREVCRNSVGGGKREMYEEGKFSDDQ